MKKKLLAGLATGMFMFGMCGMANATPSNWIDWTSTSVGSLLVDTEIVAVRMTGIPSGLIKGDTNYNNPSANSTNTYGDFAPSDVIQVANGQTFTLTFASAIMDPYIALVSIGQSNLPVSYAFNDSFSVISSGSNRWGYTGYSISGNTFIGEEYNGILQFSGAFTSLSFTTTPYEYWHGFNIGVASDYGGSDPVPEPATMLLFATGLVGLIGNQIRRKKK